MTTLAGLLGTGVGLIVAGFAWVMLKHYSQLPGATHQWAERALIAVMFIAGSALAVTALGDWVRSAIAAVAGWLGGMNTGIAHAVIVIGAFALLAEVVIGFVKQPSPAVAVTALWLPLVLSLPAGGILHQVYTSATIPAQAAASQISTWLGG
jgi:hypothetical protein